MNKEDKEEEDEKGEEEQKVEEVKVEAGGAAFNRSTMRQGWQLTGRREGELH